MAHHPARSTSDIKVTWSVAGMRCQPSSVNVEQTIDSDTVVFTNISKLVNVGGSQLQQISSKVLLTTPFSRLFRICHQIRFKLVWLNT